MQGQIPPQERARSLGRARLLVQVRVREQARPQKWYPIQERAREWERVQTLGTTWVRGRVGVQAQAPEWK